MNHCKVWKREALRKKIHALSCCDEVWIPTVCQKTQLTDDKVPICSAALCETGFYTRSGLMASILNVLLGFLLECGALRKGGRSDPQIVPLYQIRLICRLKPGGLFVCIIYWKYSSQFVVMGPCKYFMPHWSDQKYLQFKVFKRRSYLNLYTWRWALALIMLMLFFTSRAKLIDEITPHKVTLSVLMWHCVKVLLTFCSASCVNYAGSSILFLYFTLYCIDILAKP